MMRQFTFALTVTALLGSAALAQAEVTTSVRINQTLMASGKTLAPGTYQMRITDERPTTASGAPNESQRWVEFSANGAVVGRETAEVFAAGERAVGTSSASGTKAVVQLLKGGDFVRIAVNAGNARYLVHLATSSQASTLHPDAPSRIVLPEPRLSEPAPTSAQPLNLP